MMSQSAKSSATRKDDKDAAKAGKLSSPHPFDSSPPLHATKVPSQLKRKTNEQPKQRMSRPVSSSDGIYVGNIKKQRCDDKGFGSFGNFEGVSGSSEELLNAETSSSKKSESPRAMSQPEVSHRATKDCNSSKQKAKYFCKGGSFDPSVRIDSANNMPTRMQISEVNVPTNGSVLADAWAFDEKELEVINQYIALQQAKLTKLHQNLKERKEGRQQERKEHKASRARTVKERETVQTRLSKLERQAEEARAELAALEKEQMEGNVVNHTRNENYKEDVRILEKDVRATKERLNELLKTASEINRRLKEQRNFSSTVSAMTRGESLPQESRLSFRNDFRDAECNFYDGGGNADYGGIGVASSSNSNFDVLANLRARRFQENKSSAVEEDQSGEDDENTSSADEEDQGGGDDENTSSADEEDQGGEDDEYTGSADEEDQGGEDDEDTRSADEEDQSGEDDEYTGSADEEDQGGKDRDNSNEGLTAQELDEKKILSNEESSGYINPKALLDGTPEEVLASIGALGDDGKIAIPQSALEQRINLAMRFLKYNEKVKHRSRGLLSYRTIVRSRKGDIHGDKADMYVLQVVLYLGADPRTMMKQKKIKKKKQDNVMENGVVNDCGFVGDNKSKGWIENLQHQLSHSHNGLAYLKPNVPKT